jgi:hypothetical protein
MLKLLGGSTYKSVALTRDELRSVKNLYRFVDEKEGPDQVFHQAAADRNALRHAESDGLRLLAWIARYVGAGGDPLKTFVQLAVEAGLDVDPSDVEWSQNSEVGDDED